MICTNVNAPNFICRAPVDPLNQRVFSYLSLGSSILTDSVSTSGSQWGRSVETVMALTQAEYWVEPLMAHALGITDSAGSTVDRINSLSDSLGITDSFVYSGTAGGGTGGGGPTEIEAIFDSNTSKGMAVYISSDGHVDLAKSDAVSTSGAVGLANEDVTATATGKYQTEGQVEKTDWTSVTGSASLSPGVVYFLSKDTEGLLTTVAPIVVGESVVRVGTALTSTNFDIEIAQPVLL